MKLRLITLAVMAATPAIVNAAALDRSGQSIAPFFEKGNYAELSYTVTDPDLPGKESLINPANGQVVGTDTSSGSAAQVYSNTGAAIKFEPTKDVRVAVIYDQPWGVDYEYKNGTLFDGSKAKVVTDEVTTLVGTTLAPNFWVYGGLSFEDINAEVALNGALYSGTFPAGYNIKFQDSGVGYVGGAAYEIPNIALRAALTYRSKVEHKTSSAETGLAAVTVPGRITFDSPQSVNLNFQTGINPTTLLMADVRWVDWDQFSVVSPTSSKIKLTDYEKDQFSATVGLGKKLTNNFSGVAKVAYNTGTGSKNTSIFGPYEERVTFILGGKYNFNKNVAGSLGVAYSMLGDGEVKAPGTDITVSKFDSNKSLTIGGKIGYHF